MIKIFTQRNNGYSLIETIVAVSIFSIIVLIGLSSLINANSAGNKGKDLRNIIDNFNFAVEDMSRNIRDGYHYHCGDAVNIGVPQSCNPANSPRILFLENSSSGNEAIDTDQIGYKFSKVDSATTCGDTGISNQYILCKTTNGGTGNGGTWLQINPPEITFSQASVFSVLGAEDYGAPTYDEQQPLVTLRLVGDITHNGVITSLSTQTTISQRYVEF